jgi:hypothetical protein
MSELVSYGGGRGERREAQTLPVLEQVRGELESEWRVTVTGRGLAS